MALALGAACGGDGDDGEAASPGSSGPVPAVTMAAGAATTASRPAGPAVVPEILRFSASLVGGGALDAAGAAGAPVVFWFWAPT